MSATTINGRDHGTGQKITAGDGAHAHAQTGDQAGKRAQGSDPAQEPMYTRAIPHKITDRQAQRVRNFLRPHLEEAVDSIANGWAMSDELPTPAEVLRRLRRVRSPWYAWPLDALGALLLLAAVMGAYLTVHALGTRRRRRAAVALVALAVTAHVVLRQLAG